MDCQHLNQLLNMQGEIEEHFTVSFSLVAFEYCYFSCLFYLVSCQMFLSGKTMVMCFNIDELILLGITVYLPSLNTNCGRLFIA